MSEQSRITFIGDDPEAKEDLAMGIEKAFRSYFDEVEAVQNAEADVFKDEDNVLKAKEELDKARDGIILQFKDNPKELGANEAVREAEILKRCSKQVDVLNLTKASKLLAEARLREAKNRLRLASINTDYIKEQVSLMKSAMALSTTKE